MSASKEWGKCSQHFASHGVNITFNEHEFVKDSTQEPPEIYYGQNMLTCRFLSFQVRDVLSNSQLPPKTSIFPTRLEANDLKTSQKLL